MARVAREQTLLAAGAALVRQMQAEVEASGLKVEVKVAVVAEMMMEEELVWTEMDSAEQVVE